MKDLDDLQEIGQLDDPMERAARAHDLVTRLAEISSEASRLRREAIETLTSQRVPMNDIATRLGLTRARIGQLARSGPSPERALLSHDGGPVTLALGSKSHKVGDSESDMISRDASEAYDTLKDALDSYGVTCTKEIVPAPGLVNLNRDRLIVMGSPKVLPTVGQIMGSDQNFAFGADDTGRYLVELTDGTIHRSPQDDGETADCAYIGRLPRPDGQGSFLYIAGIHAAGTHGAARYLVNNAPELHKQVKDKLFSVLIRADYETHERTITSTKALTQVHLR